MVSQGFDGCIQDLQFDINKWDLNKNEAAKGVVRGCPEQVCLFFSHSSLSVSLPLSLSHFLHTVKYIQMNLDACL